MKPSIVTYPTVPCPCCEGGASEPQKTRPVFADGEDFNGIREICAQCMGRGKVIADNCDTSAEKRLKHAQGVRDAMATLSLTMLDLANVWDVPVTAVSDVKLGLARIEHPLEIDARAGEELRNILVGDRAHG